MLISLPQKNKKSDPVEPTPLPLSTDIPAQPTLIPEPTAPPTPVPSPTAVPPPTPVPLPSEPEKVQGIAVYLSPDSKHSSDKITVSELRNRLDQDVVFSQSMEAARPEISYSNGQQPVLRFSNSRMESSLNLFEYDSFTLLTVIQISPDQNQDMWILGMDEKSDTPQHFSITVDPDLPDSVRFKTEKGSVLLTLPRPLRGKAVILGFTRSKDGDRAFLGGSSNELSTSPPQFPPVEPDRFPGLQLGGLENEDMYFQGWIGELQLYNRSLNNDEIRALSKRLLELYGNRL